VRVRARGDEMLVAAKGLRRRSIQSRLMAVYCRFELRCPSWINPTKAQHSSGPAVEFLKVLPPDLTTMAKCYNKKSIPLQVDAILRFGTKSKAH
jgi:hypothetical protein